MLIIIKIHGSMVIVFIPNFSISVSSRGIAVTFNTPESAVLIFSLNERECNEKQKIEIIKIIFANGESSDGRMTTDGIVMNDKKYPQIMGADAQVIEALNGKTIYVNW